VRRLLYAAFIAVLVLTLWSIKPAGARSRHGVRAV
jgi:hypothetical protein